MKKTKNTAIAIMMMVLLTLNFSHLRAQWLLTGNSGTNATTNFIGTTDNTAFKIRTNNTERISVNKNGRVGIGTSSSIGAAILVLHDVTTTGYAGIHVNTVTSGVHPVGYHARPFYGYSLDDNPVAFHYYDAGSNAWRLHLKSADRLSVTSTGKVGIGITNPSAELDVSGDGKFSGDVRISGACKADNATLSGLSNDGNCTLKGDDPDEFKVHIEATFTKDVTFKGDWFSANKIVGNTDNSQGGVSGYALHNHPSLMSVGVYGDSNGSPSAFGMICSGNGYHSGNWYHLSDEKFKSKIEDMTSALVVVKQLHPRQYEYKREAFPYMNFPPGQQYGFVAQEMEKTFPYLVSESSQPAEVRNPKSEQVTFKMINYIGLIPVMTKAIQEQQAIIEQQNDRIARLESQVEALIKGKK